MVEEHMIKFLNPKNDTAFKKIFGSEQHKDILIDFLNDILEFRSHPIEDVQFLSPIQDPEFSIYKQSIVDVLCRDSQGSQYIIEMQVANIPGFEKRAQFYASKAYVSQMHPGGAYENLKEVIFIAITDYVLFPFKEEYKSDHVILDRVKGTRDLQDFSFTFIELPKFTKTLEELNTMIEKWCYFFKHADETDFKTLFLVIADAPTIRKAYGVLEAWHWTRPELVAYDQDFKRVTDEKAKLEGALNEGIKQGLEQGVKQGMERGVQEGIKKGLQEGIERGLEKGIKKGVKKSKLNIAKRSLREGLDVMTVAKITGLSVDEIETMSETLDTVQS